MSAANVARERLTVPHALNAIGACGPAVEWAENVHALRPEHVREYFAECPQRVWLAWLLQTLGLWVLRRECVLAGAKAYDAAVRARHLDPLAARRAVWTRLCAEHWREIDQALDRLARARLGLERPE
jgi:hypothetical protein